MIATSPIIIVSVNTQKLGMYHCTTSGNNVAGTYLVGHDTAKKGYDNNTNHPGGYRW